MSVRVVSRVKHEKTKPRELSHHRSERGLTGRLLLASIGLLVFSACDTEPGVGADGGPQCEAELAVLCEGRQVVSRNSCTGESATLLTCPSECALGACVECAPRAARTCVEGNVWTIDSCGNNEAMVEACADGCSAGVCTGGCTPGAGTTCIGDTLYETNSCDDPTNAILACESGCVDGACNGCTPNMFIACYGGDIYSLDSCQNLGAVSEECADGCEATAASVSCVTGVECTPNDRITCFNGDIHYMDSCGNVQEDLQEDCPSGCEPGGCLPCVAIPIGQVCFGGDVHTLLGGCPGTAPAAGDLVETCATACREGACITDSCIPDSGVVCQGVNVHSVDSCGVVGSLRETCTGGCASGTCGSTPTDAGQTPVDGGPRGTDSGPQGVDAGPPVSGGCSCTASPDSYPPVDCQIDAGTCNGCFGYDDGCVDADACMGMCASEFSCSSGALILGSEFTLGSCQRCVECDSNSCDGCFNRALCELADCLPAG